MKLATTTGDFLSYTGSQSESLSLIRSAGFRYADYNFHFDHTEGSGVFCKDYKKHIFEIASHAEKIGIKLVQAHSPMGDPIKGDNRKFIADTVRCIEAAGEWGIENLVVHSGYDDNVYKSECFRKNKEFFLPLLEAAEKHGVNILVENFNRMGFDNIYWIDNAPDLLEFIEYVNHPRLGAVWDVGHGNMVELCQRDALKMLGNKVKALHIHDNMGDMDLHKLPYLGSVSLDSVMHGLTEIGYDGYFTFEVGKIFTAPDVRKDFPEDQRLKRAPLSLKIAMEKFLFEMGKCILDAYDSFEE